jgi:cytochrome b561
MLLAAVVIGHIAAALKHHFIDKDGLLKRMLP